MIEVTELLGSKIRFLDVCSNLRDEVAVSRSSHFSVFERKGSPRRTFSSVWRCLRKT